jgi:hypothetical protein
MTTAHPSPEQAVRLLRAKVNELEQTVLDRWDSGDPTVPLAADLALIASLLADHIEGRGESDEHD